MTPPRTATVRYPAALPLFSANAGGAVTLEIKPYLQPFERILAMRELHALCPGDRVEESGGAWMVYTKLPLTEFLDKLTYWQRAGVESLQLTEQAAMELTQSGASALTGSLPLHRARRLRYGPHDIHEYRGKFFPQLVRALLTIAGTPPRGVVLDPMCGSGTTPCEAVASGRLGLAADLNPLSVLVARTKAQVPRERATAFATRIRKRLAAFVTHKRTATRTRWSKDDEAYLHRWFSPEALHDLHDILTQVDRVRQPSDRGFLLVLLSNVVRAVSWQDEGDLRVRKAVRPYTKGKALALFRERVEAQLDRIDAYLSIRAGRIVPGVADVRLGDARRIDQVFSEYHSRVDVLVTSPPYATALPYLDTDRLSLVVVGLLGRRSHREVEAQMIGTREVTEVERRRDWAMFEARKDELPQAVSNLIGSIAEHYHRDDPRVGFRRRNLPTLLGKYFLGMLDAFKSALRLMRPGAHAYYVVGNNSTEIDGTRVEIPTDDLLFEIAEQAGWQQSEKLSMELLGSRDIFRANRGSREFILALRAPSKPGPCERRAIYTTQDVGELTARGRDWDFHGQDTAESLHTLHPYPAKFIPQIPRKAIQLFCPEGGDVLDPFCGCGTTLLEAARMGRNAVGVDNNAVAVLVSRAKTARYRASDKAQLRQFAEAMLRPDRAWVLRPDLVPPEPRLRYWFSSGVSSRLASLKGEIIAQPEPGRTLLLAVFSAIVNRVSFQDSDTRYARIDRKVSPEDVVKLFNSKLKEVLTAIDLDGGPARGKSAVHLADGRQLDFLSSESFDLIVTSPPYLNAYDYHKYHRQRLQWIDGDVPFARDLEIGKHDEFTKPGATPDAYFADMQACFKEWSRVLRPNGRCMVVIGDAIVSKSPVAVADRFVQLMTGAGLILIERWIRTLQATRRAFNVRNSRITHEHVLLIGRDR